MNVTEEIKERYNEEAIETLNWIDNLLHKAQKECKESYIGSEKVYIFINDRIGYLTFKKYKYDDYNNALLFIGKRERDRLLNGRKRNSFDIVGYDKIVKEKMSIIFLNTFTNTGIKRGYRKEKPRRRRIPIDVNKYLKEQ